MRRGARRAAIGVAVVAGVALGGAGGCGDPGHAGQLMIVVQTDMSLPKDVDRARIEVLAYGEHKFDEEYRKLGSEESLKLPGTLGIVVGDDPDTPVTIRVTAWQGDKARVLREAVSTVPESRLAELRMPIQWLCDGSATASDGGDVTSGCGEGLTCVAGSCVTNRIDSSELPDYDDESVFGGGSGEGDGTCFDTAACMRGAVLATLLTEGRCGAEVPRGVNVAIQTEGDGICGASGCFVPLDSGSDSGWRRVDDATISLPQGLCDKLGDGTIVGVAYAPTSEACPQKDETIPTCGPWSNTGDVPDPPGVTEPLALATGQDHPVGLALDGGNVFWTNRGSFDVASGSLRGVSVAGGTPTVVLEGLASARDLAVDGGTLFFTNGGLGAADGGVLAVVPGSPARDLCLDDGGLPVGLPVPEGLAVRGVDLFFTAFGEGALYYARTDGQPLADGATFRRLPLELDQAYPYRVAFDDQRLFWTNEGSAGTVPPSGSVVMVEIADVAGDGPAVPTVLADEEETPRGLALELDGERAVAVYFTTFAAQGEVVRIDLGTNERRSLALDQSYPNGIVLDGDFVYWTNRGEGAVKRIAKGAQGEPATVIATGQVAPGPVVVDATHVYWANEGTSDRANGAIMKIQKP